MVGGRRPLPPKISAQSDPAPLKIANIDQYLLITSQLQELAKKSSYHDVDHALSIEL